MGGQIVSTLLHKKKKDKKEVKMVSSKKFAGPEGSYLVRAKFKYEGTRDEDVSFDVKEYMYVINEVDEYWYEVVKHDDQSIRGLIPANFVSKQDGSPQSVEGWRDIQRWEAEKLLLRVGLEKGSYILRPSRKENSFALSVRDFNEKKKLFTIKHFQIKTENNNDKTIYTVNTKGFPNINELISFYEKNGIGSTKVCLTQTFPDNYQPPLHFKDIEVNRESIQLDREIGRGCFGSVYVAKWGRSYEVAVKMMQSNKSDREKFLQEAKIMHKLRHRKVVEIIGVSTEPEDQPLMIIIEFMKHGSLKEYLKTPDGKATVLIQMVNFMADISEGMCYLEGQNVVHRDLRADNILVSDNLSAKVADFGLTELASDDDDQEKKNLKFPYKWTAPEAAKSKVFTSKSDIWSFGVVMYEILTWSSPPYPNIAVKEVIPKLLEGYRMPNPETVVEGAKCPDEIYDQMLKCWDKDADSRPNFGKLQEYFDNWLVGANATPYDA